MPFNFELDQSVTIIETAQVGLVLSRTEFDDRQPEYQIGLTNPDDGSGYSGFFAESELTALPALDGAEIAAAAVAASSAPAATEAPAATDAPEDDKPS